MGLWMTKKWAEKKHKYDDEYQKYDNVELTNEHWKTGMHWYSNSYFDVMADNQ